MQMAEAGHECAPTQTDSVICCPLEAVDICVPPPRADGLSKRAKNFSGTLRLPALKPKTAVRSGRELLPVRRTLF